MPEFIILFLAFPVGFLIAWLARDELIDGRKWIRALGLLSSASSLFFFMQIDFINGFSSMFILIVSGISYRLSFDKRLAVERKR